MTSILNGFQQKFNLKILKSSLVINYIMDIYLKQNASVYLQVEIN